MALGGIRDMSTMETPPEDRLPIKTYVSEFDERIVREAIDARAGARRAGLLRAQPRPQHRGHRREGARHRPRARASASATARWTSTSWSGRCDEFIARQARRARLHDDHRVRPRHPEREHDHHQPGGQAGPRAALPAPRPRRPRRPPRLRLPPLRPRRPHDRDREEAPADDLRGDGAGRRLPDRPARPGDPRRRATCSAPSRAATWRRSASTST